jgi:ketosteroid isomerase-like protein
MHRNLAMLMFESLRSQNAELFRPALDDDSTWELPGRSALAGIHQGADAILAVVSRLTKLRPIHDDAYDVLVSAHHAALTTRLVGDGLDCDLAIVLVGGEDRRLDRAFQYVFDMYAFDAFFGRVPSTAP